MGIALGVGYALVTGAIIADAYDVALGADESDAQAMLVGLAVPVGAAVLALVPAVVIRLWRPGTRESLDGFVIGALGATRLHRRGDADPVGSPVRHRGDGR